MDKRLPSQDCPLRARAHRRRASHGQAETPEARRTREIHEKVCTLDFETDPFKHNRTPQAFLAVWAEEGRTETRWGEEKEVVRWAVEKIEKAPGKIVFAHNGGKFDFLGYLFRHGGRKLWGEPVMCVGSRIIKLKWKDTELRDSYAILPAPLRDYDKGKIAYWKFEKQHRQKYREEITQYAKRDAQSLRELVCRFVGMHGFKPLTAASAAMAAIRASGVKLENFDDKLDAKFRKFYFGGRVQAFKPGIHKGHFNIYDIKSAYPHAMLSEHNLGKKFRHVARPRAVLGTDFLLIRGKGNGCFPQRTKAGLRFPIGKEEFFVTGWEYLAAKACGLAQGMRVIYAERPVSVGDFREYVETFYAQKEEAERNGDRAGKLIAKILINSGYGKLAQRPDKWREYLIVDPKSVIPLFNPEGWREEMVQETDGKPVYAVWSRPTTTPPHYYNVASAASITGFVRARLQEAAHRWKPHYCDTDSVILEGRKIKTGGRLGDWSLEVEGDLLLLAGKKLYGLRLLRKYARTRKEAEAKGWHWWNGRAWKMATKGCRLTPFQLLRVCSGKIVKYNNDAPTFSFTTQTRFISRNIRMTA